MKISAATAAVILRGGISPFIKAKRVDNNVLTRCSTCIDVDMFNNQSGIKHNYIVSAGGIGIYFSGTSNGSGPTIEKNYVREYETGVKSADPSNGRVKFNIIAESAPNATSPSLFDLASGVTIEGNICSDESYCPIPSMSDLPFTLP